MHKNFTEYDRYIHHLTEIRSLSSPSLDGISNAEGYSSKLRENFTRIGMLASDNRAFLDKTLFPLLRSNDALSEADAGDMDEFIGELEEGKGTRYAPWLVDLVSRDDVKADLVFLLSESRERNYRNTYHLLKSVHDQTDEEATA